MNKEMILKYLKDGDALHYIEIRNILKAMKTDAIMAGNETEANELWCYEQINLIQKGYQQAFFHLYTAANSNDDFINDSDTPKSTEYEQAWNCLDCCDIEIGFLEQNYCINDISIEAFHIQEIVDNIKKIQSLYPYKAFLSREMIIQKQICTICGETVSIRHPCGHKAGKVYLGKLCQREIVECKLLAVCIVSNPFDKYSIIKIPGEKYDFKALDYCIPHIEPYSKWSYITKEQLLPLYQGIARNELCPCGSGLKFKKCINTNRSSHMEQHFILSIKKRTEKKTNQTPSTD